MRNSAGPVKNRTDYQALLQRRGFTATEARFIAEHGFEEGMQRAHAFSGRPIDRAVNELERNIRHLNATANYILTADRAQRAYAETLEALQ